MAWAAFPYPEPIFRKIDKAANVLHSREWVYGSDEVFDRSQKIKNYPSLPLSFQSNMSVYVVYTFYSSVTSK